MLSGNRAQIHKSGNYRNIRFLRQFRQLNGSFRGDDTAAGINQRAFRTIDEFRQTIQILIKVLFHDCVFFCRRKSLIFVKLSHDILRYVHENRTRTSAFRDAECFPDIVCKLADIIYKEIMLRDRQSDSVNIDFLKRVSADESQRYLPCNDHHRHRVHKRCGDACNGIGSPRTAGGKSYAHLSRRAGVAVRSMCGALFMAGENVMNIVAVVI